eukprot:COSAG02_NODE_21722_length_777_cov_1.402655_1_plen_241_part_10
MLFSTNISAATPYNVSIMVAPSSWPDGVRRTPKHVPGSPYDIFVRPAELSVRSCKPPPESGPGFTTSVAGRGTDFTVVPRDRFDNVRCQDIYGLNDSLVVVATIDDNTGQHHNGVAVWRNSSSSHGNSLLCDSGSRWDVSLPLVVSGDYSINVHLSNTHPMHSLHATDRQLLPAAPFQIRVMPAWVDLNSSTVKGDETSGSPADLALATTCTASWPGSCSSCPGRTLHFTVSLMDRFGNLR